MISITKTYADFDGKERTETAWFNMTKSQLLEFYTDLPEGMVENADEANIEEAAAKLVNKLGDKGVLTFMKDLLIRSYGIRGEDGRSFRKSAAISEEFEQTALYDEIFMDLMSDSDKMRSFVESIIPTDLANKAKQLQNNN